MGGEIMKTVRRRGSKRKESVSGKGLVEALRKPGLTINEKMRTILSVSGEEKQEVVSYLRGALENKDSDDNSRIEAGTLLETLDKKEAGKAYLELLKDNEDNEWLRCSAMTFFVRDKSIFKSPEMVEKLVSSLTRVTSYDYEESETVRKQAEATLETVLSRRRDKEIPKKTRDILIERAEW